MGDGHPSSVVVRDATHRTVSADRWAGDLVPTAAGAVDRPEPSCPVEVALAAVAGKWTTLVLRDLMGGPRRFGELRRGLPELSDKVLTERLAVLRARGLVDRREIAGFPVGVVYELTDAGRAAAPAAGGAVPHR